MPHAPSVWIDLRPPRHGWLDYTIELGVFRLEESASWVLNDPLEELVETGLFLAGRGTETRRVCLWAEPGGYALDVWNVGDALSQVRIGSASDFVPPMAGRTLRQRHECTVDRTTLARAIRRAVHQLFLSAGPMLAHPHWRDPTRYAVAVTRLREIVR